MKAARKKKLVTYKGSLIKLSADLSTETLQARKKRDDIFKVLKEKNVNQEYYNLQSGFSEMRERQRHSKTNKS